MTALVQSISRYRPAASLSRWQGIHKRTAAVAVMVAVVLMVPGSWHAVVEALSDAYLAVTVFVAGTLALVFAAEHAFKTDLGKLLQRYQKWQVPAAATLGAFPGCGGAIVAITQYSRGHLSFGGVVATLTSTMGDAMFLLLAREPQTAVVVMAVSVVVAIVAGYLVDGIHGPDFMRPNKVDSPKPVTTSHQAKTPGAKAEERLWMALIVPGIVIGLLAAFQVDVDEWFGQWIDYTPAFALGILGAVLAVAMWVRNGGEQPKSAGAEKAKVKQAVIYNTNFVTAWVVFAFVGYEVLVTATGIDLASAFSVWGPLVPAVAVVVGLIPGCGPQILVTSMYLSGAVPMSAQMANAIANDGDALFPAIAVAPKAAMMATVYSAIPALLVGYGWYLIFE